MNSTVSNIMQHGKGVLAIDASIKTADKLLKVIGIEGNPDVRRDYRELFFGTNGIEQYISGAILHDETIKQSARGGRAFTEILKEKNIEIGIKVDQGTETFIGKEMKTNGLPGLAERLDEYKAMGATFTKWRSVFLIGEGTPSDALIEENTKTLTEYARTVLEAGLVPMVEPEVLISGDHSIEKSKEVMERILSVLFEKLSRLNKNESIILKSSMATEGDLYGRESSSEDVAEATLGVFRKSVPQDLGGIVFLSGGQGPDRATENLNAMARKIDIPLSFSYARALQNEALSAWQGNDENVSYAREVFMKRLQKVALAREGKLNQ